VYHRVAAALNDVIDGSESMQPSAKPISIAILSRNKEEEKAITEAIGAFDVDYVFESTLLNLRDTLLERPCNGIMFCITSLVGIDHTSKSFIQTLEQVYPVARIRWNKSKGSFSLIASRSGRIETISDFITICSNFAPRRLRRSERLSNILNVSVSAAPDFSDSTRTFTINISPRGCFLHTLREWHIGDSVFIQIRELPGRSVIAGRVIRCVPWGIPFQVQGIGIQFTSVENKLIEELQRLLYDLPVEPPEEVSV
jgi:Tfp pilus assembly protein PilZ